MKSAKPAFAKVPTACKGGSGRDFVFGDRHSMRFLLANVGGAAILAVVSSRRSGEDSPDFTYEIGLLIVGVLFYLHSVSTRAKSKGQAPKTAHDNRSSAREPNAKERQTLRQAKTKTDLASRRHPRSTPSFNSVGWEAEIDEFLRQVTPTGSTDIVLQALAQAVQTRIKSIVPEARVACFTSLNLVGNNDVGSLEADITIQLEPGTLAERMEAFGQWKMSQRPKNDWQVSERKSALGMSPDDLAKMTLRMLTRELAYEGYFLYHHCSYKEREPKVVLRVPAARGISTRDIFVGFTVNSQMPARMAALGTQLTHFDHKAFELALLARRWARDRGIAYAAKGHLSPYAWTCLVGFFLQQRCCDDVEKPIFGPGGATHASGGNVHDPTGPIGELFWDFLRFYVDFDWSAGVISLRLGRQIAWPDSSLGQPTDTAAVAIEDPVEPTRNVAETMTPAGFERLRDELARVRGFLEADCEDRRCTGLKKLLEAWMPPKDAT